uniref:Uncharacterized protein n=1 Tax=Siphoviridae sp. ctdLA8 TaxID=2826398 RepID=A0A8S5NBA7_9CAUD|nr:MAG TPA: hypothetical protein [Siphoviridae sp. ctdLA8]
MAGQYNSAHTGAEIDQAVSDVQNNKVAWSAKELPAVTTADNGKFLRVVSGAWAAAEIANANGGSF